MAKEASPSKRFREALESRILSSPTTRKPKLKEIIAENLDYIEEVLKHRRADVRAIAEELGVAYEMKINEQSLLTIFYTIRSKRGAKERPPIASRSGHAAHLSSKPTPPANPPATDGATTNQQHRKSVEAIRRDDPDL